PRSTRARIVAPGGAEPLLRLGHAGVVLRCRRILLLGRGRLIGMLVVVIVIVVLVIVIVIVRGGFRLLLRLGGLCGLCHGACSLLGTAPYRKKAVEIRSWVLYPAAPSRFRRPASSTVWRRC